MGLVRNRLLLVLCIAGLLSVLLLPFISHAPNRLVSGGGIGLVRVIKGDFGGFRAVALLPGLALLIFPFLPQRRSVIALSGILAALFILSLSWLAGDHAAKLAEGAPPAARTSLASGFWVLTFCAALALIDALQRLRAPTVAGLVVGAAVVAGLAVLGFWGAFDHLSLAREIANRREVFEAAVARHILLVLGALLPAVLIGVPLGFWAHRRASAGGGVFAVLNLIQTIPSMALFGLMIAPLAALGALIPWAGISGIGPTPAIIALVAYSLLPVARNTAEGLAGVPAASVEAGRGMGMTGGQLFWRVEMPLALPVLLSGLRITAVQAIGLAAVAALIGAGGLGAIMFEGLFSNALDLVVLGALPVIFLALATDGVFRLVTAAVETGAR